MTITDDDLRSALHHALATADLDLEPPPMPAPAALLGSLDATNPAAPARRRLATALAAAVILIGLVIVASLDDGSSHVTTTEPAGVGRPGRWTQVDDLPIPSRQGLDAVWTGDELVVLGGYEASCPPNGDCFGLGRSFRDAASLDPATGTWRQIADPPIKFLSAGAVAVDGLVYLWTMEDDRPETERGPGEGPERDLGPTGDAAFLRYDPASDRWTELPHPFDGGQGYHLAAAGSDLVLNPSSDDGGSQPVRRFDPATETWDILPDDPLPRLFDRQIFAIDGDLFLFGRHVVPAGSLGREPLLGARLDLDTMRWKELPDTGLIGDTYPLAVGDTLVSTDPPPNIRGEDRGPARIFDPADGTWSDLPEAPYEPEMPPDDRRTVRSFLTETGVANPMPGALVLDLRDDTFFTMPELPARTFDTGQTLASAGTTAVALGGVDWDEDGTSTPRQDAWIWLPPT